MLRVVEKKAVPAVTVGESQGIGQYVQNTQMILELEDHSRK